MDAPSGEKRPRQPGIRPSEECSTSGKTISIFSSKPFRQAKKLVNTWYLPGGIDIYEETLKRNCICEMRGFFNADSRLVVSLLGAIAGHSHFVEE